MKMHFVLAALLMIGAAGCASVPTETEPTQTAEAAHDVPATVESTDFATASDTSMSADPMGGSAPAPVIDETPASLGASSSGRGH
jgi:hypothetical protein